MEKITSQFHSKETFLYAIARTLERASYYGLRAIIVLYMIEGILKMERSEALAVYGWFIGAYIIAQILGAILGDLILGNKKAIILGGIIQSLGAFSLCIYSTTGLYVGLALIVLGGGLYSPNISSNFGKLYLNKTKLLDAGFTVFFLAINIGAWVGIISIGTIGENYSWNVGFIIAGIMMLFSIIPILLVKDNEVELKMETTTSKKQRIVFISFALFLVGVFWAIYEISSIRIFNLQLQLREVSTLNISEGIWSSFDQMLLVPFSLLAFILWTYFYNSQFFKLMIGFIFGAISYGIIFMIPEIPSDQHTVLYIISISFLSIAEVHISLVVYSILTQYGNPKYLAILISLASIPTRFLSYLVGSYGEGLYENQPLAILIGVISMCVLSLVLIVYNQKR